MTDFKEILKEDLVGNFGSTKYSLYGKYTIGKQVSEGEFYELERIERFSQDKRSKVIYLPKMEVDSYFNSLPKPIADDTEDMISAKMKVIHIGGPRGKREQDFEDFNKIITLNKNGKEDQLQYYLKFDHPELTNLGKNGEAYLVKKVIIQTETGPLVSLKPSDLSPELTPQIIYVPINEVGKGRPVPISILCEILQPDMSNGGGSKQKTRKNRRKSNRRR